MIAILLREHKLTVEQAIWLRHEQIDLAKKIIFVDTLRDLTNIDSLFWDCYETLRMYHSNPPNEYVFI